MSRLNFTIVLAVLILAGLCSCSHTVAPPSNEDKVTITGPKSGLAHAPFLFSLTINFTSSAVLMYKWTFDDSTFIQYNPSVPWTFSTLGQHIIKVSVLSTFDSTLLCSTVDTFTALNFIMTITPDSLKASLLTNYTFTANLNPFMTNTSYKLIWTIDSIKTTRLNTDTISWNFNQIGVHHIQAVHEDSTGALIETASAITTIQTVVTASPSPALTASPVNFTISHVSPFPVGTRFTWNFGDGVTFDTTADSVNHSFGYSENLTVSVLLHKGTLMFGSDSTSVRVSPNLTGYNLALFNNYHKLVVSFIGDNQFSYPLLGSCVWGNQLWDSETVTIQDSIIQNTDLQVKFSADAMQCDSLSFESGGGGSQISTCGGGPDSNWHFGKSWHWSQTLSLSKLALIFFTPDSVGYAVQGSGTQSHVIWNAKCTEQDYDCSFPGGSIVEEDYSGTNWNGSPTASATVTLYK